MSASTKIRRGIRVARYAAPVGGAVGVAGGKAAKAAAKTALKVRPTARTLAVRAGRNLAPTVETVTTFATDKVAPAAVDLAGRTQERLADTVIPAVVAAAETAYASSEPVRNEALRRGSAAWTAMREPERLRHRRRWPLALLCLLLGAAAGAAGAVYLRHRDEVDAFAPDAWDTPAVTGSAETSATTSGGGQHEEAGQVVDLNANEHTAEEGSGG